MRRERLRLALLEGPELGPPPAHLNADQLDAWYGIVGACDDVLCRSDRACIEIAARALTQWRNGDRSITWLRLQYRMLGKLLIPMPARRRLIFGPRA